MKTELEIDDALRRLLPYEQELTAQRYKTAEDYKALTVIRGAISGLMWAADRESASNPDAHLSPLLDLLDARPTRRPN